MELQYTDNTLKVEVDDIMKKPSRYNEKKLTKKRILLKKADNTVQYKQTRNAPNIENLSSVPTLHRSTNETSKEMSKETTKKQKSKRK